MTVDCKLRLALLTVALASAPLFADVVEVHLRDIDEAEQSPETQNQSAAY